MNKILENKPRLIFWIGFLLILIMTISTLFILENQAKNPKYLAIVNGEGITREDLNYEIYGRYLKGTPDNPEEIEEDTEKLTLDELVVSKISTYYLKENNAEVSESEIERYITENLTPDEFNGINQEFSSYQESDQQAMKASIKNRLSTEKVKNEFIQSKSGEYLFFRFDKYIDLGQEIKAEGTGNQKLIDEQREYAKKLAERVSDDLNTGKINFEKAREIIINEPEISAAAFAPLTPNMFGTFSADEYQNNLNLFDSSVYSGFKEGLANYKEGDFTKPITLKAYTEKGYVDIAYIVANVQESSNENRASNNYQEWLNLYYDKYNVTEQWPSSILKEIPEKLKDIFKNKAEAGTGSTCSASYSGSHRTNLRLITAQQGASGQNLRANVGVKITAGLESKNNGLLKYRATDCNFLERGYSLDRNDNTGDMYLNNNALTFKRPALIDCSVTSIAKIYLPKGDGHWAIDTSEPEYRNWVNNFITNGDGSAEIHLKLGTTGSWANGTLVTKRVVWHPNPTTPPSTSNYYKVDPAVGFWKINPGGLNTSVTEASPGDTIFVEQKVFNFTGKAIPEIYLRNNIDNNGVNNTSGSGTFSNPYSIRRVTGGQTKTDANIVCASISPWCHSEIRQGSGNYDTPAYDKLVWRYGTLYDNSLQKDDNYEDAGFIFKIPDDNTLINKYLSTRSRAWGTERGNSNYSSGTSYFSNQARLKIVQKRTLTVKVNNSLGGVVIGGLNSDDGDPFECNSTTGCTKNYDHNTETGIDIRANTGYQFTGWASGTNCPATSSAARNLTMNLNRTCTANFTPITYTLTTQVSPTGTGTVSPAGSTTRSYNEKVDIVATRANDTLKFINWTGSSCGAANTTSASTYVMMTQDRTCTANFNYQANITLLSQTQVDDSGSLNINWNGSAQIREEKTKIELTAKITDPDGDKVRFEGFFYKRAGASVWSGLAGCGAESGWSNSGYTKTCSTPQYLDPGNYEWVVAGKDQINGSLVYSSPVGSYPYGRFTIPVPSCSFPYGHIDEGGKKIYLPPKIEINDPLTTVNLNYNTQNAWKAEVDNGVGAVPTPNGSFSVTPPYTYDYTMEVTGSGLNNNKQTCTVRQRVKELYCKVSPTTGPVSLVVQIQADSRELLDENENFTYRIKNSSGTQIYSHSMLETSLRYTLNIPGTYRITVSHPKFKGGAQQECPDVTATDPGTDDGGEKAP
jgi:hypothetical protein